MDPSFDHLENTTASAKHPKGRLGVSPGHYLVGIEGQEAGKLYEVGAEPLTMRRDARQTLIFVEDSEVSRLLARVSLVDNAVVLEDLSSTNGTFVNARCMTSTVTLPEGNVLRLGQLLKYEPSTVRRLRGRGTEPRFAPGQQLRPLDAAASAAVGTGTGPVELRSDSPAGW